MCGKVEAGIFLKKFQNLVTGPGPKTAGLQWQHATSAPMTRGTILYFDPFLTNILQVIFQKLYFYNLTHFCHTNQFGMAHVYGHAELTGVTKYM